MEAIMGLEIKRIYELPADSDGYRVLVDRLWPRGVSTGRAANHAVVLKHYLEGSDTTQ